MVVLTSVNQLTIIGKGNQAVFVNKENLSFNKRSTFSSLNVNINLSDD